MAYFLTDKQEYELNLFLDEENRKVYDEQMKSDEIPQELKDLIKKTEDDGSPLPAFDPTYGYYTISFTPCKDGNRIYVHHHLSNKSKALYDPAILVVNKDVPVDPTEPEEQPTTESTFLYDDLVEEDMALVDIESLNLKDEEILEKFPPPPEVIKEMQLQSE